VQPTDTTDPDYYHKVVDCQWACPAHTNVPEYIRLIAHGRYGDAYMLNRYSNVFPSVLGRTCDRPCEPACRRTRVDEKPVAICRLKRVAADHRGDIEDRLPTAPEEKNGKKIALIGAGPASLTVANDLMPLGYECTIFEKLSEPGGLMRSNIPPFRLPEDVLNTEINYVLDMGVEIHYNSPVESLKGLLDEDEYDAVFIGTGAPKGKDLWLPGRQEASDQLHIGINWLESVAFEHIDSIGKNVIIIGAGNTAMDCCRTSKRLGGENIHVIARKPRHMLKASEWELEDAEEELIDLKLCHSPEEFLIEDGKLVGMRLAILEYYHDENGKLCNKKVDTVDIPCDEVILAIGQDNAFPWIERDIGIDFNDWEMPEVDRTTFMTTRDGVFVGGDAAWGPENIIWAVAHGHQAAISVHNYCQGVDLTDRPPRTMNLASQKMSIHEWSFSNDYDPSDRRKMTHVDLTERFKDLTTEVELGFTAEQFATEVQRCLNCDVQTGFTAKLCIECDACVDVCPTKCLTMAPVAPEEELRKNLSAPAINPEQALFVSEPLPQTGRAMIKDEDVCIHCGLCAERCPTAAWDMQKFTIKIPQAEDVKCEGCACSPA
jgi:NADPH-dependent glutamate synthase beta subunit-like oxidoreductase